MSVPFENLDVQLGRPLTTRPEAAYEKIVERGRGGWCYEQNGLFGWALSELGFEVTRLSAAVMREARGPIADDNHLSLLVRCGDGAAFLADVGFGGSMLAPLQFAECESSQPPYRLGLRSLDPECWQFWEDHGGGEFSYDFRAHAADETALSDKCDDLQSNPESSFVLSLVAQRRLPAAHLSLRGRVLKRVTSTGSEERRLESADELVAVLAGEFSLYVPEIADLWPRIVLRHNALFDD